MIIIKNLLQKSISLKRTFNYKKGECTLNFELKVDNSSELRNFKSCLEEAIKDIDETLKGMKN